MQYHLKKTIIFLIACFAAAGWWQHDRIADFYQNQLHFSWLSFAKTDYASIRTKYMEKGVGPVRIAFIAPGEQALSFIDQFFQDTVNGAKLAAELVNATPEKGRKIELVVTVSGPGYETVDRSISSLGKDASILAVIPPYSLSAERQSEVFAEYMGLLIFHIGHMFAPREEESYLAFSNTYPFEQFSQKLARYAKKRGVESVLMLTEKGRVGENFTKNQSFWFSKKGIPVPTAFLYERDMIYGLMLSELHKKIDIFGTDTVYWGSALDTDLLSMGNALRQLHITEGQTEHLMFLPVVADNDSAIRKRLELIEASTLDPVIAYPVTTDRQQQAEFDRLYWQRYKTNANHAAYYGYDTFMLVADCINKNHTATPQNIARILTEKSYKGILATYRFNADGMLDEQVNDNIRLGTVKNGNLVELDLEKVVPREKRNDSGTRPL